MVWNTHLARAAVLLFGALEAMRVNYTRDMEQGARITVSRDKAGVDL
jgi:hypothetical protein